MVLEWNAVFRPEPVSRSTSGLPTIRSERELRLAREWARHTAHIKPTRTTVNSLLGAQFIKLLGSLQAIKGEATHRHLSPFSFR
jgi:hypothetical protein